ncbi:hypothetical protein CLOSTHATH_06788, partial [Hungatella hathewayi DSM 13479]
INLKGGFRLFSAFFTIIVYNRSDYLKCGYWKWNGIAKRGTPFYNIGKDMARRLS